MERTTGHRQRPLQPNSGVVLIDFDNCFDLSRIVLDEAWSTHNLNRLLGIVLGIDKDIRSIHIRFYGGWYEDRILTKRASQLLQALGSVSFFPLQHPHRENELLRGEIELVTRLLASPMIEWLHTKRSQRGLHRIRLQDVPVPDGCPNQPLNCPLRNIYRFTKHKKKVCPIESCTVTNRDAFVSVEQKMVDALLVCDMVEFATEPNVDCLLVVSADADILPGIAVAVAKGSSRIVLGKTRGRSIDHYDNALSELGVTLLEWE